MIEASTANVVTPKASTPPSTDMDRALDPSSGGAIDPSKWKKYNYEWAHSTEVSAGIPN